MFILMDEDKTLLKKHVVPIYQGEALVDKVYFKLPKVYRGYDLTEFEAEVRYKIPGNVGRAETLVRTDIDCEETHFCYMLPINSKITTFAGDISLSLVLSKNDLMSQKKYVMCTSSVTLTITPTEAGIKLIESTSCGGVEFDVVEF